MRRGPGRDVATPPASGAVVAVDRRASSSFTRHSCVALYSKKSRVACSLIKKVGSISSFMIELFERSFRSCAYVRERDQVTAHGRGTPAGGLAGLAPPSSSPASNSPRRAGPRPVRPTRGSDTRSDPSQTQRGPPPPALRGYVVAGLAVDALSPVGANQSGRTRWFPCLGAGGLRPPVACVTL